MRLVSARCYADLVDRAPKAIAGMRVVMACVGGPLSSSGADEDQSQMILKLVRKLFYRVCEHSSQHPITLLHLLRIQINLSAHLLELGAHLRHARLRYGFGGQAVLKYARD